MEWTGKKVIAFLRNPLLHGEREFGRTHVRRMRTSGQKRRCRDENPRTQLHPELAHLSVEDHRELLLEMDRRVAEHPRQIRPERHPKGRARSRTFFPGQLMQCVVCGGLFYWHGDDYLKCCNAGDPAKGRCWNHIEVKPSIVRREVLRVLVQVFQDRPDAKAMLIQAALAECQRLAGGGSRRLEQIDKEVGSLRTQASNLAKAVAKGGQMEDLLTLLKQTRERIGKLEEERAELQTQQARAPRVYTEADVEREMETILDDLMARSYGLSELMRRVIPVFSIVPMAAVDTLKPAARARLTFSFGRMADSRPGQDYVPQEGDFTVELDLWDPPAHICHLRECVRLNQEHPEWSAQRIAQPLGIERWTVRSALKLWAQMRELGLSEPYQPVTTPEQVSRWRMVNSGKARWDQTA